MPAGFRRWPRSRISTRTASGTGRSCARATKNRRTASTAAAAGPHPQADRLAQAKRTGGSSIAARAAACSAIPPALTAGRGRFTVELAGGTASSHWAVEYTFAYDAAAKDWLLEKEKNAGDDLTDQPTDSDGEGEERSSWTKVLNRRQLGDIPLERFDYEASDTPKDWRVRSDRAYFHDRPDVGSRPRTAYVLRGDRVKGFRERATSWRPGSREGPIDASYLLKKDLEPAGP